MVDSPQWRNIHWCSVCQRSPGTALRSGFFWVLWELHRNIQKGWHKKTNWCIKSSHFLLRGFEFRGVHFVAMMEGFYWCWCLLGIAKCQTMTKYSNKMGMWLIAQASMTVGSAGEYLCLRCILQKSWMLCFLARHKSQRRLLVPSNTKTGFCGRNAVLNRFWLGTSLMGWLLSEAGDENVYRSSEHS